MTRVISAPNYRDFTTARLAEDCHISRSLASQYLNELVRQGLVVKINERPVLFMHRRGLERFLQTKIEGPEIESIEAMLALGGYSDDHDFDMAIGFELSYGTSIEHLKSALRYPPHGLPVLMVGEHGTGKQMLSKLTYEHGVNQHILPEGARYIRFDCLAFENDNAGFEAAVFGSKDAEGAAKQAAGGIVYLEHVERLTHVALQMLLQRIAIVNIDTSKSSEENPARFILATSRPLESEAVRVISRTVPIVVSLPRYVERSVEERTLLVQHYLRVEGRRVAADVGISRGALRALVNADFSDNIDGLQSCITNCCASAYLSRAEDTMTIHTYNLPANVLGTDVPQPDDDRIVRSDKRSNDPSNRVIAMFQKIIDPLPSYTEGSISFVEFRANALAATRAYGDYMNFEAQSSNARVNSYEQLISPIIEEVNRAYGIELTRRTARLVAQSLFVQVWASVYLAKWRAKNAKDIHQTLAILRAQLSETEVVVEQIATKVKNALGIGLDDLAYVLLFADVEESLRASSGPRDYLGVVMCHGYSTATSIADAADRILHTHVFEAIDMTYDQELSDAMGQLSRLLRRFAHCKSIAILVDMGSLESVNDAIAGLVDCDIYVLNNVSTALAIEVGSALVQHRSIAEAFESVTPACVPSLSIVKSSRQNEVVVFCSESGIDAADKIRRLVWDSVPLDPGVELITCDFAELSRDGARAAVFSSHRVRAIVGTMDPGITAVPFIALEDILYQGSSEAIDQLFFHKLGPEGIAEFHANLLRNLTLKNVIESITILNPEMLYIEADRAVERLCALTGETIDAPRRIGLYMHLCGLIERLVTNNFVDTYPGEADFVRDNAAFIEHFREAFSDMTHRYRVEIPVSEIGYVHHMIHLSCADSAPDIDIAGMILEDE